MIFDSNRCAQEINDARRSAEAVVLGLSRNSSPRSLKQANGQWLNVFFIST